MSEALYAVVLTPQQTHNLMQLINKGLLKPFYSFEIEQDDIQFDDPDKTELMFRVYVHVFIPELNKDFFESVAKYINEMFRKKVIISHAYGMRLEVCLYCSIMILKIQR